MSKLAFVLPLAALLSASLTAPTRAESLSCSSVNGTTLCSKSGSTSCQSVNGKTTCCETVGNRTECHETPATNPPRRAPPQDRGQNRDQGQPDDDDTSPPLLLPDRTLDISSMILGILLLDSIRPAAQPVLLPVFPVLRGPRPSLLREITLARTIDRNRELLLLTGKKLPVRRCVVNCGALNSFDRVHRP
jgi:hypothetical protein